jgi:AcrR family transcriptional regulator
VPDDRPLLRRHRIVVAARRLVAEEGVEALSLRRLADRLDVSPAALYAHVESKDDLLRAVAEVEQDELESRLADVAPRGLRALALARLDAAEAAPAVHLLVATRAPTPAGIDDLGLAVRRLVDGIAAAGDPPERRRAVLLAALDAMGL